MFPDQRIIDYKRISDTTNRGVVLFLRSSYAYAFFFMFWACSVLYSNRRKVFITLRLESMSCDKGIQEKNELKTDFEF